MRVLIIDMIVDGHLVDMNPFFYAELGNQNVESSIQYADYFGLADNGTITLGQIRYKLLRSRAQTSRFRSGEPARREADQPRPEFHPYRRWA
jgi:hypothetical protein